MPQSVPCPNNDKGICTIPDPAVVVTEQGLSLVRADLADHLITARGRPADLTPLEDVDYDELVSLARRHIERRTDRSLAWTERDDQAEVFSALGVHAQGGRKLIVNCSCGHTF